LKKHYCAFLHPPRKAKASKEGKRKKGSDLKRSSMKKTPGARAPMAHAQFADYNYKWIICGL